LIQIGRVNEAAGVLTRALASQPDDPDLMKALADCETRLRHGASAVRLARAAVSRRPDDADAHAILAFALLADGKLAKGVEASRHGVALAPSSSDRLHNHAVVCRSAATRGAFTYRRRRLKEAATAAEASINIDPTWSTSLTEAAQIALLRSKADRASELASAALAIEPLSSPAHLVKGRALARLKDIEGASRHFTEAGALNPRDSRPVGLIRSLRFPTLVLIVAVYVSITFTASIVSALGRAEMSSGTKVVARVIVGVLGFGLVPGVVVAIAWRRRRRVSPAARQAVAIHRKSTKRQRRRGLVRELGAAFAMIGSLAAVLPLSRALTDDPAHETQLSSDLTAVWFGAMATWAIVIGVRKRRRARRSRPNGLRT